MILRRKYILLALLELFGGKLSPISFQKYLFLYMQENATEDCLYEFAPYRYGCFSFKANRDMRSLAQQGYIEIEPDTKIYTLHGFGYIQHLDLFEKNELLRIKQKFGNYSQTNLVRYVYVNYPFFAIRSKMAKDVLTDEEFKRVQSFASRYKKSSPMLFTIGYEGLSLEKYIIELIKEDVHVLVDVRKNAFSMKYGFSKGILSKACENVGITYIHMPQLGIESNFRQNLKCQDDYDQLFEKYEKRLMLEQSDQIVELRRIVENGVRVALTCFEKDPKQCHRSIVAKQLMLQSGIEYQLSHL